MVRKRRRRPRGVVDTSVLVAGVAGFRAGAALGNASAKLLRDWVVRGHFIWLLSEVFCACAEMGRADFLATLNLRDFPQDRLRARVVTPGEAF